jgi:hypothetical protein
LRDAASAIGEFLGAKGDDLVFIDNTTEGVNAILWLSSRREKGHFPSTRHFVTPDRSHAALTELAFDTVWSEISARSQSGESQILQQVRSISDCKPLEKLAAYWLRQKRFDFATQYGIPLGQIVGIPYK